MAYTHFNTWLRVKNSVREKKTLTSGTTLVDEIKSEKVQRNEEKCRNFVKRNLCLELSLMFIGDYLQCVTKNE